MGTWAQEVCDNDTDDDGDGRIDCQDAHCRLDVSCVFVPPDPASVAPPRSATGVTTFYDSVRFLFEGDQPVIRDVAAGALEPRRAGAVCGRALDDEGQALSGVAVSVLGRPELGRTYTREDGAFDAVFNGGGSVTLQLEKPGYVPIQRQVQGQWEAYHVLDDLVFVPLDTQRTLVDFSAPTVARARVVNDARGVRQTSLYIPEGVRAELVFENGATRPLESMHVRATEVTVGEQGPRAMPGTLPATSAYTYAAEFTVDEAIEAGAQGVRFDQDVYAYVDNFLGIPAGAIVPNGFYDREQGVWKGERDGVVIAVLDGAALDADGDGRADAPTQLGTLGIDDQEAASIAEMYRSGDTFWRVPLRHLSPFDFNFSGRYPPGTSPPPSGGGDGPPSCGGPTEQGSLISCEDQTWLEQILLSQAGAALVYHSGRVPGRLPVIRVPLRDVNAGLPAKLQHVRVEMEVAGRRFDAEYEAQDAPAFQEWSWDRRDGFGRLVQGAQRATTRVTYVYENRYALMGMLDYGVIAGLSRASALSEQEASSFAMPPASQEVLEASAEGITITHIQERYISGWDTRAEGLGGWTLDMHHRYDPIGRALHFGDGASWRARRDDRRLSHFIGKQEPEFSPSPEAGEDALAFYLHVYDAVAGPDGSVYLVEVPQDGTRRLLRRVTPEGVFEDIVGRGGAASIARDEEPFDGQVALDANFPHISDIAVDREGTLYFSAHERVWRVDKQGRLRTVAGGGDTPVAKVADGAPPTSIELPYRPAEIAPAPDGSLYFATSSRILRLMPNGTVSIAAGSGAPSCITPTGLCGDGEVATQIPMSPIESLQVGSDGTVYFLERPFARSEASPTFSSFAVRAIQVDGTLRTIQSEGIPLSDDVQIALGPNDEIYVGIQGDLDEGLYGVAAMRVLPDGQLVTIAGAPVTEDLVNRTSPWIEDGGQTNQYFLGGSPRIFVMPSGELVVRNASSMFKVEEGLPGYTGEEIQLPSMDGSQIYRFSPTGRHLETREATNGRLIWSFDYDDQGYLVAVDDAASDRLTITRDERGIARTIEADGGASWELQMDEHDNLTEVRSDDSSARWAMAYTPGGLMTRWEIPTQDVWELEWDEVGRFVVERTPEGETKTLEREAAGQDGEQVTYTSASGRETTYSFDNPIQGGYERAARQGGMSASMSRLGPHTWQAVETDGTTIEWEGARSPDLRRARDADAPPTGDGALRAHHGDRARAKRRTRRSCLARGHGHVERDDALGGAGADHPLGRRAARAHLARWRGPGGDRDLR